MNKLSYNPIQHDMLRISCNDSKILEDIGYDWLLTININTLSSFIKEVIKGNIVTEYCLEINGTYDYIEHKNGNIVIYINDVPLDLEITLEHLQELEEEFYLKLLT